MTDDGGGILVPVAPTQTLEETVSHAVARSRETGGCPIHLVRTVSGHHVGDPPARDRDVVERAERRAREAAADDASITTAIIGTDRYLATPAEHVERYLEYGRAHDLDRVVLDPNYSFDATAPTLQSLESMVADIDIDIEEAPVDDDRGLTAGELVRAGVIGVVAFVFYVALGGPTYTFALASGVVTAIIAAALLRNVAFETTPHLGPVLRVFGRGLVFVPYMLWEITKANVLFAYVVLHPSLPIDPRLDSVEAAVGSGLSVTSFANSITLTPGTLTVDADGHHLLVHSLNASAQEDLFEGVHERAVRFLFYGRDALSLDGPAARGDVTPLVGPDAEPSSAVATDGGIEAAADDESASDATDSSEPAGNPAEVSDD
ncbi:monovalent cation/H+ antiporter subunit E [Natrarchaeobaculum aegyptiacum]|uniref:Cation:proton antiporter n=1 Tax=Natrarchaeobaculum aegyptiacum TaxID=745377 RepID=A0A2Z2HV90_9EURY|nr:monovalent cation/H+ antiporter subunit E [Natrarchaeobaculum aegyptiacum]ARS88954.1 cation:proton antiporter [Natrarchaeobaculum aegyptiacum]